MKSGVGSSAPAEDHHCTVRGLAVRASGSLQRRREASPRRAPLVRHQQQRSEHAVGDQNRDRRHHPDRVADLDDAAGLHVRIRMNRDSEERGHVQKVDCRRSPRLRRSLPSGKCNEPHPTEEDVFRGPRRGDRSRAPGSAVAPLGLVCSVRFRRRGGLLCVTSPATWLLDCFPIAEADLRGFISDLEGVTTHSPSSCLFLWTPGDDVQRTRGPPRILDQQGSTAKFSGYSAHCTDTCFSLRLNPGSIHSDCPRTKLTSPLPARSHKDVTPLQAPRRLTSIPLGSQTCI